MTRCSIAILGGGSASRFGGRDKGALVVDGRSILERQLDALLPLTDDLMMVGRSAPMAPREAVRAIADIVPGSGPLAGIHAALTAARHPAVLVVACDMPFVTTAFAGYLLSLATGAEIVVPRSGDRYHPLCAVYARAMADTAAQLLAERRLALHALVAATPMRAVTDEEIRRFGAPSQLLANVNTPAEYADLEALQDHKR